MGAFGLDALSSVAYGPDEILYVLLLAGAAGLAYDMPIALAIALLLAIVATSYRQTIRAYPRGGGSYTVARENIGVDAGLVAAAALMVDYVTTVAVSVTAGVAALVAVWPQLDAHRVVIDVFLIAALVYVNLRGVREAGSAFVLPTYLFVGSVAALIVVGGVHVVVAGVPQHLHPTPRAMEDVNVFLILRAFAGGCTAMTGVEAIANGVPAFRPPQARNAARTLMILATMLGVLFLGIAGLGLSVGAIPSDRANVLAQVGQAYAGGTPLFYLVQASASVVLLLAANTSFNGFPRLAAVMAEDDWFPHLFTHRGLRLAYSNGIIVIGVLAAALIIVFNGSTHALIPLFAVGVFLCFTLSQAGMVRHWLRAKGRGRRWRAAINGTGAAATGVVTVVVMATKFVEGAWIVLLAIPFLVVNFHGIHAHYQAVRQELALDQGSAGSGRGRQVAAAADEIPRIPGHAPIVVAALEPNRATAMALDYARSLSDNVTLVHVATGETDEVSAAKWRRWCGRGVHVVVVRSPYREVVTPLIELLDRRHREHPDELITLVLPRIIPRHFWEEPLHNHMELAIRLALREHPGIIVATVPVKLRR